MALLHLAGQHAAVVGATGVIGLHIAQALARHGAVVSLLGRTALERRSELAKQLEPPPPPPSPPSDAAAAAAATSPPSPSSSPVSHRFLALDISDDANVEHVFAGPRVDGHRPLRDQEAQADRSPHVGPVDILVNCAGVAQTTVLRRTSDDALRTIVDTNLLATMRVCKHARVRPRGCIINVSSLMAIRGGVGATAYAASKAGVIGFTRALCRELAPRHIRVNALLPGWVDSYMWKNLKPELQQAYLKDTPIKRVAHPSEVAHAAVFLATNQFANNCVLNLDGGLSAA